MYIQSWPQLDQQQMSYVREYGSPSSMDNTERGRSLFGPRCIPRRAGDRQYTVSERKLERDGTPTLRL